MYRIEQFRANHTPKAAPDVHQKKGCQLYVALPSVFLRHHHVFEFQVGAVVNPIHLAGLASERELRRLGIHQLGQLVLPYLFGLLYFCLFCHNKVFSKLKKGSGYCATALVCLSEVLSGSNLLQEVHTCTCTALDSS